MSQSTYIHEDNHLQIMVKVVRFCFVVAVFCATIVNFPKTSGLDKHTKKFAYNNNGLGTYSFEFETSHGIYRREDGGLIKDDAGFDSMVVRGEYGYLDPEGRLRTVRYVADSNGYQPLTDDEDARFNDRRIF